MSARLPQGSASLGFCVPLLIARNDTLVDGEARLEAARLVGLDRVPCIVMDHLSESEQRLLRLAVNRIAERGEWDLDELKVEFEELLVADAPIELTGFTGDEIDQIILEDEPGAIEKGPLVPDPSAVAVAGLGDVFLLGRHRLICGDAADPEVLQRLMVDGNGRQEARIILTDEPHNVPIAGNVTGGAHREFKMASGEMTEEQFLAFNLSYMEAALPFLCGGGILGTFID
jgi:hypothetical protein